MPGTPDWRRLIAPALDGRDPSALRSLTADGIVVGPLYGARRDVVPLPGRRKRPWTIVQILDHSDPDQANAQAMEDLAGGARGLSLRFAGGPSAAGFGLPPRVEALEAVLQGIDLLGVEIRIEPDRNTPAAARGLRDFIDRRGVAPETAKLSVGLDPATVFASAGAAGGVDVEEFVACFCELRSGGLRGPLASIDGRIYHEAGATEAQELAAVLASAVWWIEALDLKGIPPAESLPLLEASLAVDCVQFVSIAKLRALPLLIGRLQELCGMNPAPVRLHVQTSRRMLTRADVATNLLRTTIAAFAAGVAGADSIAVHPHTYTVALPNRSARALARNMQHLLIEECHLHAVADPAAGSGAVEALTDALAQRAWAEFQAIQREGGIMASLAAQLFQARIKEARERLRADVNSLARPLVGVTSYPEAKGTIHAAEETHRSPDSDFAPVRLEELVQAADA